MSQLPLYRNARARGMLELFLLSAISSLLAVRFYLYLAGYPQIGGDHFHIAHMLWGGMLMLAGMVIALSFIGARSRWLTAFIGGAGFGIFIDEIGKFITHDNDYFFRPAIGIIYATFVVLYLIFNFLSRSQRLTSREYLVNALSHMEEVVASDMDSAEKAEVLRLLDKADQGNELTRQLRRVIKDAPVVAANPDGPLRRVKGWLDERYRDFWKRRQSSWLVRVAFIAEAAILLAGSLFLAASSVDELVLLFAGSTSYMFIIVAGQIAAGALAAGYIIYGAILLPRQRLKAFEQFRRATLINLLLTQVFIFFRDQLAALPGFALNLGLLLVITYVIHQEYRLQNLR